MKFINVVAMIRTIERYSERGLVLLMDLAMVEKNPELGDKNYKRTTLMGCDWLILILVFLG
jgi:hypothetical protein